MELAFRDKILDRLEVDPSFTGGYQPAIVKAFRKRIQGIRNAVDERDLYAMKSWHFERLKGNRQHQHSIRLNNQFRLILEVVMVNGTKRVDIVGIEDYH